MASERCTHPNPRIDKYVTLPGKMDFADAIKLRLLRWKDYHGLSSQCKVIKIVFIRGKQEDQSGWRHMKMEAEVRVTWGHEPTNSGGL